MDELRNLWCFVQVARAGSFTAAAERLAVSTAALSKNIARLEAKLGVRLFIRTTRSLQLTGEGQSLYERLANAFGEIEASVDGLHAASEDPAGVVRLTTVTAYGKHCVLPVLHEFLERYPRIDLLMSFHDTGRGLTRQSFDIRINWGEEREQDKVAHTLCSMPLVLVGSPAYFARRGMPRTPEDLQHHDCVNVALASGVRARWTFTPKDAARRRRSGPVTVVPKGRVVVMDELDAVVDAAQMGLGLTVTAAENALQPLRAGTLIPVLTDYDIAGQESNSSIIIQYPRRSQLAPRVRVLADFLVERLKGKDPLELAAKSA